MPTSLRARHVILYGRNQMTLQALSELGYEQVKLGAVLSREEHETGNGRGRQGAGCIQLVGSEQSRARGGPRCLTMPLNVAMRLLLKTARFL